MEYYLPPIVADTGHGGLSAVMKLVKLFAESGATVDVADQEFILGTTNEDSKALTQALSEVEGCGYRRITGYLDVTFNEAVEKAINNSDIEDKTATYDSYLKAVVAKSTDDACSVAEDIVGHKVFWRSDRRSGDLNKNQAGHTMGRGDKRGAEARREATWDKGAEVKTGGRRGGLGS
ncbi:hypothetical protein BDZ89DRAFT_1128835 [Hymenopellis radicata]|nr:hypothetical protein BDZ89DRAFT_1128835 [Hymenopellis radicata]